MTAGSFLFYPMYGIDEVTVVMKEEFISSDSM